MRNDRLPVFLTLTALLSFAGLPSPIHAKSSRQVESSEHACRIAKSRYAARHHFPVRTIAICDFIAPGDSPKGYYILALHSKRDCDGICSTSLGWFAIQIATGGVFETNVEDWRPGKQL
jgi:hypothetical protein